MKIKVCGMKYNPGEVAALAPDYLGFIFWEGSARHMDRPLPADLPRPPARVGVFVNAGPEFVRSRCAEYHLDQVQLHGSESPEYCRDLELSEGVGLIKAFGLGPGFDFGRLAAYAPHCDAFLFDSRGPLPGGNGTGFNWEILAGYDGYTPYFLSGGIGPDSLPALSDFLASPASARCMALDVNSRFETKPGLKDVRALQQFMDAVRRLAPAAPKPDSTHE